MKRTLLSYNLIITTLLGLTGLFNASNLSEVIFAGLFFPLTFYFAWTLAESFRRRPFKNPFASSLPTPIITLVQTPKSTLKPTPISKTASETEIINDPTYDGEVVPPLEVKDINRRLFLKLIGSAGMSVFFLSLFTRQAQGAFFGSVPGPGTVSLKDTSGTQIDPAKHHPTDGYKVSELDDATLPAYYGFVHKSGAWYIMKEASDGTYRYTKGNSGYSTNWTDRDTLTYGYFDDIFG